MAAAGTDRIFHFCPPYAQVNAVDFRVVCSLDFLDISVLKGRLTR